MSESSDSRHHASKSHHHHHNTVSGMPPVASHTLTPMLDDSVVLYLVDDFLHRALQHPTLRPFYLRIDRLVLRQKLAAFICQLFGGLPYDHQRMSIAHKALRLDDNHFNAVMEVLDKAFDSE